MTCLRLLYTVKEEGRQGWGIPQFETLGDIDMFLRTVSDNGPTPPYKVSFPPQSAMDFSPSPSPKPDDGSSLKLSHYLLKPPFLYDSKV